MKTKLLTSCLFLIFSSTQLQAARPSTRGLQKKLDILINALVVCPSKSPHRQSRHRFVDNGDGTICDHETGLMWEKKNADDGAEDLNNPHDVDNGYTWTNIDTDVSNGVFATNNQDGTAFTDFLARLNGVTADTASEQLGGYSDWRLPTSIELQTLLFEAMPCSINPCIIDPIFVPTATSVVPFPTRDFYLTSTDEFSMPGLSWIIGFSDGRVITDLKGVPYRVRAVRGGR